MLADVAELKFEISDVTPDISALIESKPEKTLETEPDSWSSCGLTVSLKSFFARRTEEIMSAICFFIRARCVLTAESAVVSAVPVSLRALARSVWSRATDLSCDTWASSTPVIWERAAALRDASDTIESRSLWSESAATVYLPAWSRTAADSESRSDLHVPALPETPSISVSTWLLSDDRLCSLESKAFSIADREVFRADLKDFADAAVFFSASFRDDAPCPVCFIRSWADLIRSAELPSRPEYAAIWFDAESRPSAIEFRLLTAFVTYESRFPLLEYLDSEPARSSAIFASVFVNVESICATMESAPLSVIWGAIAFDFSLM